MATMQPIRNIADIDKLKNYFLSQNQYRNYALFVLGINLPLRINDILSLKWKDLYNFEDTHFYEHVRIREKKTGKINVMALNNNGKTALELYMQHLSPNDYDGYVFFPKKPDKPLSRISAYLIIKKAANEIGLEFVGCHSLRKTFGYHAWKNGAPLAVIMSIYNHSSIQITKRYLGVEQSDKDELFEHNNL